jgi:hypothetical protein
VLVKLAGSENKNPVPVKLLGQDDTGIWFQNSSIAKGLIGDDKIFPPMLNANPTVFLPLCQLEWMMVPGTDVH